MAGVNRVQLIGHLGKDPEIKQFEGDNVVANVSLATTESYKDRSGNKVENTEWHDLEIWGQQAKIAEQYLKKGSQVYVEGKIKTEKWEDKDGQKRSRVKIRVTSFTMLGSKQSDQTGQAEPSYQTSPNNTPHASISQPNQSASGLDLVPDPIEDTLPF